MALYLHHITVFARHYPKMNGARQLAACRSCSVWLKFNQTQQYTRHPLILRYFKVGSNCRQSVWCLVNVSPLVWWQMNSPFGKGISAPNTLAPIYVYGREAERHTSQRRKIVDVRRTVFAWARSVHSQSISSRSVAWPASRYVHRFVFLFNVVTFFYLIFTISLQRKLSHEHILYVHADCLSVDALDTLDGVVRPLSYTALFYGVEN